ncbi:hypothetical protein Cylst_6448 (plasmid) [Cylindrospermum stagnale PCC 7417]|uniref:Uncharacterized protein n=1 Tax=Cylindrospermum stagnale PCC 7417 TaxID=56107 RepID=K9X803_9NOST|nr:hypothetical protein [Cylindrospermum stagnale]AFZ28239.1 hypothetical protein Cylst_6448 [Cylindrospermum stagnale PCC 7417]
MTQLPKTLEQFLTQDPTEIDFEVHVQAHSVDEFIKIHGTEAVHTMKLDAIPQELQNYLQENPGVTSFSIRIQQAAGSEEETTTIYIRPLDENGITKDFIVSGDNLIPIESSLLKPDCTSPIDELEEAA